MLSMKNEIEKIWDDVLVKLEQEHDVSSAAINAWIKPLHIKDVQSNNIILSLDAKYDERGIQFIKKKMYDFYISLAISDLTGKKYDIEFELEKEGEKPQETPAAAPEHDNNNLNPRYTFDTFVIGDNTAWHMPQVLLLRKLQRKPIIRCFYIEVLVLEKLI